MRNEGELARILAHELGHHRLGHVYSTKSNEYAADEMSMVYIRGLYDKCKAVRVMLRRQSGESYDHPSDYNRWRRFGCKR